MKFQIHRLKIGLYRAGLIGLTLLFSIVLPVEAVPSQSGSTGMIRIPTADALRLGQFSAGYYGWQDHSVAVAAFGLPRGLELSTAFPWERGQYRETIFNAKFNLNQEALLYPSVSLGIEDIDGRQRRSVYGVLSKTLPLGFRVHIGTGTGRFEGMFAGIEKVLNPTKIRQKQSGFPVTSVLVEMDGYKMNYGLRFRLMRGLRLEAGWQGKEERIYWGMTFTQ